jgi:hypothetical protein
VRRARIGIATLLATLSSAACVLPTPAAARLPGPSSFATGFVNDDLLEYPVLSIRTLWWGRIAHLDATWTRLRVQWNEIAPGTEPRGFRAANPSDRHYSWAALDAAVRSAAVAHVRIVFDIAGPPKWDLGAHAPRTAYPGTWRPKAKDMGAFARALAKRYDGRFPDPLRRHRFLPKVSYFQIWNEPNLTDYLEPQWIKTKHGYTAESPILYRALLNAGYAGITAVQRHAYVMAGGTAPYGDPPGGSRMQPVTFTKILLCLKGPQLIRLRCPHPAHLNALDDHPYSPQPTSHAGIPGDVSVMDQGRLWKVLHKAQRAHTVLPRGRKTLWATELDWPSNPPGPENISLAHQARDLSLAYYELWRQGISHVMWFLIQDAATARDTLHGAGVYFANNKPKPSAQAARFPFVALPGPGGKVILWGRSPTPGRVAVESGRGHGWRTRLRLRTTAGGVFYAVKRLNRRLMYRAVAGRVASLGYRPG